MSIYRISFDFNLAFADISEPRGQDTSPLELSDETPDLLHQFNYNWLVDDSDIIPDLILIMSKIAGASIKVYKVIQHLIPYLSTEEISVGDYKYKILLRVPILKEALNIQKSKVTRFSTGDIMLIDQPVFYPKSDYPHLFRIDEEPSSLFCTQELYNCISSSNLMGWKFEECPVKKSWLQSVL